MYAVKYFVLICFSLSSGVWASDSEEPSGVPSRVFEFEYEILAADFPTNEVVDIYIPMPVEYGGQEILDRQLQSSTPGEEGLESEFNNRFIIFVDPLTSMSRSMSVCAGQCAARW